ncbi:MAG: CoA pyrophosphatase [Desulfobacteraceae bacterium]
MNKQNQSSCYNLLKKAVIHADHPLPCTYGCYRSASVIALIGLSETPYLLYIKKADLKGYPWRNQMAFPGGHSDFQDKDGRETALRELKEEMGISEDHVDVVGSIGFFQTINNREIEAFIGIWDEREKIRIDPSEISKTFFIPVPHLMKIHREKKFQNRFPDIHELTYPYEDVVIWGVTAKITHHFLELLLA